ncbi:DUF4390 domain-containing protein [Deefgea chitinilytica]|uniref:DUF4390 domain-containing protein n=2 Tax=Chitinibacteraceae TaxID=2897177 RepID=A0ABS2C7G3_9NEIS|nr:DUF4390 domain-containing protein [Deefgea chitinilytica]
MMVFITRFFQKRDWQYFIATLLLLCTVYVHAGSIKTLKSEVEFNNNRIELSARYAVVLSPEIESALKNGLSLPFTYDFKLTRPLLYSWYRSMADGFTPNASITYRLSYQPLTRQYRLNTNGLSRNFNTAEEALLALSILRNWSVLEGSEISADDFAGKIRFRLDHTQLPKSYQLTALGDEKWLLDSGWQELQRGANNEAAQ